MVTVPVDCCPERIDDELNDIVTVGGVKDPTVNVPDAAVGVASFEVTEMELIWLPTAVDVTRKLTLQLAPAASVALDRPNEPALTD